MLMATQAMNRLFFVVKDLVIENSFENYHPFLENFIFQ
jgi:hypothetical protein